MHRSLFGALVCLPLFAQAPATDIFQKAPPHVDEALRARVSQFFQAHVDGKFRQADELVAEESKDAFFEMNKRRYLSFEIVRINYAEDFTKATVVTATELEWSTPRLGKVKVKPPMTSVWKLENGQWYWYAPPQDKTQWQSPWGTMRPGPDNGSPVTEALKRMDPKAILEQVKISGNQITLSSYEKASGSVTITNNMPGEISLDVETPLMHGLEIVIDKKKLQSGETANVIATCSPIDKSAKPTLEAFVRVAPTGQVLPVKLVFAVPPEVETQLRKSR